MESEIENENRDLEITNEKDIFVICDTHNLCQGFSRG